MNTLLDGTPAQVDKLGQAAIRASIVFNRDFKDAVLGMKTALSAGIKGDELEAFMYTAGTLANALGSDFNKSIDVLTSFKDAYGLTATELARVNDQIFNVVDAGKVNIDSLTKNYGRVVSIAAQAGVSFRDLNVAIATLTRTGMTSAQAVTSVVNIISDVTNPTKKAAEAFDKLGIAYGSSAFEGKGLLGVIDEIRSKNSGNLLNEMFSERFAQRGVAGLVRAKDLIAEVASTIDKVGTAEKAAETATNTFGDNFERTWKRSVSGPLTQASSELGNFLNKLVYGSEINATYGERINKILLQRRGILEDIKKISGGKTQWGIYGDTSDKTIGGGDGTKNPFIGAGDEITSAQEAREKHREAIRQKYLSGRLTAEQKERITELKERKAEAEKDIEIAKKRGDALAKESVAGLDIAKKAQEFAKQDTSAEQLEKAYSVDFKYLKKIEDARSQFYTNFSRAPNGGDISILESYGLTFDDAKLAIDNKKLEDYMLKVAGYENQIAEARRKTLVDSIEKAKEYANKLVEERKAQFDEEGRVEKDSKLQTIRNIQNEIAVIEEEAAGQKTTRQLEEIAKFKDYQIKIEQIVASSEEKKQKIREDYNDKAMKLQDDYFKKFQDIQDKINGAAIGRAEKRGPRKAVEIISGQYQTAEAQARSAAARGDKVELDRLSASMEKLAQAFDANYTNQGFRYSTDIYQYDRNKSFSEVNQEKIRGMYNTSYGVDSANLRDKGVSAIKSVDQTTFRNIMSEELKRANDGKANITNSGNTFAPVINASVVQNIAAGGDDGIKAMKATFDAWWKELDRASKAGTNTTKSSNTSRDDSKGKVIISAGAGDISNGYGDYGSGIEGF
jgi:TP901 family phage tail tape measure protein